MKNKTKAVLIILFLSVFIIFFSYENQKAEWKGKIEKENGVKVIKNPREPMYGEIKFELEEDLSIGREDDENFLFNRVMDIQVDSKGNIYVADTSNYRIQKFDRNGKYLQTIGRQGQGPGEFEYPSRVRINEITGKIYVQDLGFSIEIFDKQGNHVKGVNLRYVPDDFRLHGDESIMVILRKRTESGIIHALCKVNSEGEIMENYGEFPHEWFVIYRGRKGLTRTGYELSLFLSKLDSKAFVYGYSKEYELNVIDNEAQVLYRIKKDESYHKFNAKEKRQAREWKAILPSHKPFFYLILTDCKGRIYVQTNKILSKSNIDKEVDVFSKDGYYLYKSTIPRGTYVIKDGYLYAYVMNEDTGLELVKRFRIKNWEQIKEGI